MCQQVSCDPAIQAAYVSMRQAGESHSMAEMLALQQSPFGVTDNCFVGGHCNGSQFADDPDAGDAYLASARRCMPGFSPTGKVYKASLAKFPGDPKAWVPTDEARGYAKRLCEERNWSADGVVKHKAREPEPPPLNPGPARDLVNKYTLAHLRENPHDKRPTEEIREEVKEKISPRAS